MSLSSDRPIAAVIAVVVQEGRVLLVRRAHSPDAGLWGFPGGKIEFGEGLAAAAERELFEETGVRAEAGPVLTALDVFDRDDGRPASTAPRQHFILLAMLCRWISGTPQAADDALEAGWFDVTRLDPGALPMSADVDRVARLALRLQRQP